MTDRDKALEAARRIVRKKISWTKESRLVARALLDMSDRDKALEGPASFVCQDCGVEVFRFGYPAANDHYLCAECTFLRSVADPEEREKLREFLRRR